MNTTHTPGPWYLNIDTVHIRKGVSIQPVTRHMDAQGMADARLIAAAPDLLAALAELVAEADAPHGWEGHKNSQTYGFKLAREAIAKATGVK